MFAGLLLTGSPLLYAYETDQVTNRGRNIKDSTEILNQQVNDTLRELGRKWRGKRNEKRFISQVYHKIGGHHWVDRLERWAMNSEQVEKLDIPRYGSIYSHHPISATRVTKFFGVGPTIKLNNQLIGSDKIGHFISQGKKFNYRWRRTNNEELAAERSAYTERAIFGQMTTGSYSNADLVANYEGHRFYRSLFEDEIIPGKESIMLWNGDRWELRREFDWADHVNAYWDEGRNINHYDRLLYKHMVVRLKQFCSDYHNDPNLYFIDGEVPLAEKYAMLQLRPTTELRLYNLCDPAPVDLRLGGLR
jgi:hypothetical protein